MRLELEALQQLAMELLHRLGVADTVYVTHVQDLDHGLRLVGFVDASPRTTVPTFQIGVYVDWPVDRVGYELRQELRKTLQVCPLCQRRSDVQRLPNRDALQIACDHCHSYVMSEPLLNHLRYLHETDAGDIDIKLARLAAFTSRATREVPVLDTNNWLSLTDVAAASGNE